MKTILVPVICPTCKHEAYVKSEQFIIPSFQQKHRLEILNGSFFSYCCPLCATQIEFLHACLYHDHQKHLLIALQPFYDAQPLELEAKQEPIQRLVRTPKQLQETIRIFEDHLHDVAMKHLKRQMLCQFKKQDKDVTAIYYHDFDIKNELLWFEILDGEHYLQMSAVPKKYYDAIWKELENSIDDKTMQEVNIS